jgi:hypothetical protein
MISTNAKPAAAGSTVRNLGASLITKDQPQ